MSVDFDTANLSLTSRQSAERQNFGYVTGFWSKIPAQSSASKTSSATFTATDSYEGGTTTVDSNETETLTVIT